MADVQALHKFLRGEFDSEASSGFARLRRVPDTHVRHFLDYYQNLNPTEQDALADASTLWGTLRLAGRAASDYQEVLMTHPAWEKWRQEMSADPFRDAGRYLSVPLLRACVAQAKIDRANHRTGIVPKELEEYAATIRSVKAPDLRKHVRSVLRSLLGAQPAKLGGGDWQYEGTIHGSRVLVNIDYGGSYAQLRYEVAVQPTKPFLRLHRAGFETVLGAGHGDWDFIVEENVSDAMASLTECVGYVAELPQRLPEGCLNEPDA